MPRRRGLQAAEAGAAAIAGENAGDDLRARDARAAHRGRAEQHHALLGARTPARRCVGTRRDVDRDVVPEQVRARCYQLLAPFATHGVSMSRFESRPARTGRWEYLFFVDLVGHRDDAPVKAALGELAGIAPFSSCSGRIPLPVP